MRHRLAFAHSLVQKKRWFLYEQGASYSGEAPFEKPVPPLWHSSLSRKAGGRFLVKEIVVVSIMGPWAPVFCFLFVMDVVV